MKYFVAIIILVLIGISVLVFLSRKCVESYGLVADKMYEDCYYVWQKGYWQEYGFEEGRPDEKLFKRLGDSVAAESAVKIIKENSMGLFGSFTADLENSGSGQNLVFWGSGIGCGSCHSQDIYVLSKEGKIILKLNGDDPYVVVGKNDKKEDVLVIDQPVRRDDEPLCCPTTRLEKMYKWNAVSQSFEVVGEKEIKVGE